MYPTDYALANGMAQVEPPFQPLPHPSHHFQLPLMEVPGSFVF
jgi:hypothetical protein